MNQKAEQFQNIQALYDKEKATHQPVRTIEEIPFTYEDITSEWLTRVLCSGVAGAEVVGHDLDVADDATSNRRRIFIRYNQAGQAAGLPASVFCKASQSLECRYVLGLTDSARSEIYFYQNLRPLLDIEAPTGLFGNIDTVSMNSILMLRDLGGKVEFCKHDTPITFERAASQVRLLARVHGRFFQGSDVSNAVMGLRTFGQFFQDFLDALDWANSCRNGFLETERRSMIPARLVGRSAEVWEKTLEAAEKHSKLPVTLIHNDVHLRNWYIAEGNSMGLGDWQGCKRGHWSRDLAYVMATSLTIENRRNWEKDLIGIYLDEFGKAGGEVVSFDEAFLFYRQQLFNALMMWTGTLTPSDSSPDMQPPEASLEFIRRITHAIDDHDALKSFG